MFQQQCGKDRLLCLLLGWALVATLSGCFKGTQLNTPIITPQHRILCGSMPQACRSHVYVFFILGIDPLDCADLGGLREHLQKIGFTKSYLGDWFYKSYFAKEMVKIAREDPLARFALIGYCLGASTARELAEERKDGPPIDLLVYLGGGSDGPRPGNVLKLLNIQGSSHLHKSTEVEGAENVTYPEVGCMGSVTHRKTLDVLVRELTLVGSRVPVIDRHPPPAPFLEPRPRPLPGPVLPGPLPGPPGPPARPDEWDFLQPRPLVPAPDRRHSPRDRNSRNCLDRRNRCRQRRRCLDRIGTGWGG